MAEKAVYDSSSVSYLTQREASEIDENLMGPLGFSVDQLMVGGILYTSCASLLMGFDWLFGDF